jgi:2,4-dienoyl-CoA reductase-like NADH-dependent reductase (Old Yellow Enzyme family)
MAESKKFDWFEPIKVGEIEAKNRIFMASLTRKRGDLEGVGNDTIIEYYK